MKSIEKKPECHLLVKLKLSYNPCYSSLAMATIGVVRQSSKYDDWFSVRVHPQAHSLKAAKVSCNPTAIKY